jgi:hypothetical protein
MALNGPEIAQYKDSTPQSLDVSRFPPPIFRIEPARSLVSLTMALLRIVHSINVKGPHIL